jgi:foldase protein PrsA
VPATVLISACGGVPGNAIAEVDGEAIEKTSFDHWMSVAAKSGGQPGAATPDPPDYAKCVAALKKVQPKPAEGQPKVSDAQLKTQCKQQYESLRDQVVQLLASFKWIEGEAEEMELKVSDQEIDKKIAEIKKQQFPQKGSFEKFLKDSGFTNEDIRLQTKQELLTNKIPRQGHQGLGQGQPGRDQGLLRQEQAALRPA